MAVKTISIISDTFDCSEIISVAKIFFLFQHVTSVQLSCFFARSIQGGPIKTAPCKVHSVLLLQGVRNKMPHKINH